MDNDIIEILQEYYTKFEQLKIHMLKNPLLSKKIKVYVCNHLGTLFLLEGTAFNMGRKFTDDSSEYRSILIPASKLKESLIALIEANCISADLDDPTLIDILNEYKKTKKEIVNG